jgi:hypothetical protein
VDAHALWYMSKLQIFFHEKISMEQTPTNLPVFFDLLLMLLQTACLLKVGILLVACCIPQRCIKIDHGYLLPFVEQFNCEL